MDEPGLKAGPVFGILRAAVTGQTISPPLLECMEVMGKTASLRRIDNALAAMAQAAP